MQADSDLVAIVDDLLRTDPRLIAASPLIGRVAVLVKEPKPERTPRKGAGKKRPPPRPESFEPGGRNPDNIPAALDAQEEAEQEQTQPLGATWLKAVKARKVSDSTRAWSGDRYLMELVVDGGLFAKLRVEDQRRALALGMRGLVWSEDKDGKDAVKNEKPPLQCWPDTADDLSHLVAALGPDGAEGATAVGAAESLASPVDEDDAATTDEAKGHRLWVALREARSTIRDMRRLWANQLGADLDDWSAEFPGLAAAVRDVLGEEPGCEEIGE